MSFASFVKHLRIDSDSVVTHSHFQAFIGVFEFKFDSFCIRVAKCIEQRLSSNPIHLLLDRWIQRLLPSRDTDAKINIWLNRELLLNAGQGYNQIHGARIRRTESLNRTSAFVDPSIHDL